MSFFRARSSFIKMSFLFGFIFISFFSLVDAHAAVEDQAGLFSDQARNWANTTIREIESGIGQQVVIRTEKSMPDGKEARAFAEEEVQRRKLSGLLLLVSLQPHKRVVLVSSPDMHARLSDEEALRQRMIASFEKSDFDGGLRASLLALKSQLDVSKSRLAHPNEDGTRTILPKRRAGISWFWILLGIGGVVFLASFIISRFSGRAGGGSSSPGGSGVSQSAYPSSMGGGYGGGGGSWVKPVVGGIAGAMAGNWIYDQLSNRSHADDSRPFSGSSSGEVHNDGGQIGGSFGSSGGADDWGAGDTSSDSGSGGSGGDDW